MARLAGVAVAAWRSGLDSYTITLLKGCNAAEVSGGCYDEGRNEDIRRAKCVYDARGLVAKGHWRCELERTYGAFRVIVDIRAADSCVGDADKYIVWVGELWNGAVFEGYGVGLV